MPEKPISSYFTEASKNNTAQEMKTEPKLKKATVDPSNFFGRKINQKSSTMVRKSMQAIQKEKEKENLIDKKKKKRKIIVDDDEFDDSIFNDPNIDKMLDESEANAVEHKVETPAILHESVEKHPVKIENIKDSPNNIKKEPEIQVNLQSKIETSPKKKQSQAQDSKKVKVTRVDTAALPSDEKNQFKSASNDIQTGDSSSTKNQGDAMYDFMTFPQKSELPKGAPNCLQGFKFLFTGDFQNISRQDAQDLVKRYGGAVVTAPSSKVTHVAVGLNPGPSKMQQVAKLGLKTIDEEQFYDIINSSWTATPTTPAAPTIPPNTVKKKLPVEKPKHVSKGKGRIEGVSSQDSFELWTVKYKPQSYDEIIGNNGLIQKLTSWIKAWEMNKKAGFPKTNDFSTFKAALLSGPPGLGKTTAAHLVARMEGFEILEFNASDARSKKILDQIVKESTRSQSVHQMFSGNAKSAKKKVLIMDEVDGMSSGDRGGSTELLKIIKETKIPIICICNDRQSQKIKTLANYCLDLKFRKPTAKQVETRIIKIAEKEGLKLASNAVGELVASTGGDIRQILNLLSTYRLNSTSLSFDESKKIGKTSMKNIGKTPFDVLKLLVEKESFRTMSFADKLELYFQDFSLIPLFVQENYLRVDPAFAKESRLTGKKLESKRMELISRAAESISLGNLIEACQRRENAWSLLPAHAAISTIRPCFYTHGYLSGMANFPSFLGQYSKASKGDRILKEFKAHMQLETSGDKYELRFYYIPTMIPMLIKILINDADGIDKAISFMDEYHITKDDWDSIMELGFEDLIATVPTKIKTALTRAYNGTVHIAPYSEPLIKTKKSKAGVSTIVPDSEEVLEVDLEEEEEENEEIVVKPKKKPKKSSSKK